jgi:hypothetical protein
MVVDIQMPPSLNKAAFLSNKHNKQNFKELLTTYFFDLSITEKTLVVEMRIWCIKIGNVLVLHTYISLEHM